MLQADMKNKAPAAAPPKNRYSIINELNRGIPNKIAPLIYCGAQDC